MWQRFKTWAARRKHLVELVSALAYVSTAEAGLSMDQVAEMGAEAQRRNNAEGITGILVFNGRNFFQIVEGDREPLYALLRRLRLDTRHMGLSLVYEREQTPRVFGDWGMRTWQSASLPELAGELPKGLDPHLANLARSFARLR